MDALLIAGRVALDLYPAQLDALVRALPAVQQLERDVRLPKEAVTALPLRLKGGAR